MGWGGARKGAGRKPITEGELRKARSVTLTDREWAEVKPFIDAIKKKSLENRRKSC